MAILVRNQLGNWQEPSGHGYDSEAALQDILYRHPSLIPGVAGDTATCRELKAGFEPADIVVIDSDANISVVECRLTTNGQAPRVTIDQLLDHVGKFGQMSIRDFEEAWSRADPHGPSPFTTLNDTNGHIRASVADHLAARNFNLVLAIDNLTDDIKRTVELLNAITRPNTGVLAIGLSTFHASDVEILSTRVYGSEIVHRKRAAASRTRPPWSVDQYREWVADNDPSSVDLVHLLLDVLALHCFIVTTGNLSAPSLEAAIDIPGLGRTYPLGLNTGERDGATVEIRFNDFKDDAQAIDRFAELIAEVPQIPLTIDEVRAADYLTRPNIPLNTLTPHHVVGIVLAISSIARSRHSQASDPPLSR